MLYIITNRKLCRKPLEQVIHEAVIAGAEAVILREKDLPPRKLYELAERIKPITQKNGVPLIINRSIEVALAVKAEGVHLGHDAIPIEIARGVIPHKMVVGASVHSVKEAEEAEAKGADYLLAGHVFKTSSKPGMGSRGVTFIKSIRDRVSIPVVAIGGIDEHTLDFLVKKGISDVAVMSAVMEAQNVFAKVKKISDRLKGKAWLKGGQ